MADTIENQRLFVSSDILSSLDFNRLFFLLARYRISVAIKVVEDTPKTLANAALYVDWVGAESPNFLQCSKY